MEQYQIGKGKLEQYDEMIDFGNLVFKEDFKAILPKLYDGHPETAQYHHVLTENGRVRAMVGCFPLTLHVNGETLAVRGIGTVSAHPYDRGKGYMSKLMPRAVEEAREEGADLMVLCGRRQRYEHFGFAICGTVVHFTMIPENRRHCRAISTEGLAVLPLAEHPEYQSACSALHDGQPLHAGRGEERFLEITQSWSAKAFVLLEQGTFAGYCSCTPEGMLQELVLKDEAQTLPFVMKLLEEEKKELTFAVPSYKTNMIAEFLKVAEGFRLFSGPSFQVFHYPKVIRAFLGLKAASAVLPEGSLTIEVQGMGRYEIQVEKGQVSVEETRGEPEISLPPLDMMRFLFAPESRFVHQTSPNPLVRGWLPIPITLPQQDNV